jgi:hypothetical protein
MQADAGRGCGGKSLFLLESREAYRMRLNKFAEGNTFDDAKVSMAIGRGGIINVGTRSNYYIQ